MTLNGRSCCVNYFTNSTSKTWKNYKILHEIGRGGMGVVYKAQQISPSRIVAIKFLKASSSPESKQRFIREMQIVAQLQHSCIPKIYDAGIENDYRYIVMDYIPGKPFAVYIEDKSIPFSNKLDLFIKICHIVKFAHRSGVIHRDLKPENIIIHDNGDPIVIDFGLAKHIESEEFDLTKTGDALGTLHYMAPEQIAGKRSAIDHQADIYALGAVLFELITHQRMIKGSNIFEVMCFIQDGKILPPSQVIANVDKNLEVIWRNATAVKKSQRYPSMGDFIRDIKLHSKGKKVKNTYRQKSLFTTIAIAICVFVTAVLLWHYQKTPHHSIELSHSAKERLSTFEKLLQCINDEQFIEADTIVQQLQPVNEYEGIQIAKAYYRVRKYDHAMRILQDFPDTPDVIYQQALVFYQQKKYVKAHKNFAILLEKHPEDSKLNYYLGMCLFETQPQQALKFLLKAEENFSEDVVLLENIATIYRTSDVDKAEKYLKKCLELSPSIVKYTLMLGKINLEKENYYEAFAYFRQALISGKSREAMELLHEIPYNEPLLRELCYQIMLYYSVAYQDIREPDLFTTQWEEIEVAFRRDYVTWQDAYKNHTVSAQPFLKRIHDNKLRESTRNALLSLRYSKSFATEVGQAQVSKKFSLSDKKFFLDTYREAQQIIAAETLGRVYYSLACMYRNHSWQHHGFLGIEREFLSTQLHRETNTFLKYLLAEGYLNIFGFDAIIEAANNKNVDIVTRIICCCVLRKHYMAVDIEVFSQLPQVHLPPQSMIFLQTLAAQAMYTPYKYQRRDTFRRLYDNNIPDFERKVLEYLLQQKSLRVKISAAASLCALFRDTHKQLAEKANDILISQMQHEGNISHYAHFMFWKISPARLRGKVLPIYKKALLHKDVFVRRIALANAEFFGEYISDVVPEIDQCVHSKFTRLHALFAWSLNKKLKTTIFKSSFYQKWFPHLSPLEKTLLIISRAYHFSFDMRSFDTKNAHMFTSAVKFLTELQQELNKNTLPAQSQCMISYILSLLQIHPSLQRLQTMKDPKLLAYYLHQLKQEVNIGSQQTLLLFFKTQNSKERQRIAKYFLTSSDPQVQMFAISSYVAFAKKEEQNAMYNKALSSDITNKKGVALGLYYSFLNQWIRQAPPMHSLGLNFFSGKALEEIIDEHFKKVKLYIKNVTLPKRRELHQLLERACTLDPQESLYLFAKAYLFPNDQSIKYICEAKVLNQKWEAGSLLDIYTGKLAEICIEKQQPTQAIHHIRQHRFSSHAMHIADIYYDLKQYSLAQRAYEIYFLANVNYINGFPLRQDFYGKMASVYFIQKKPTTAKHFIDYLHELARRRNWSNREITKENFVKNIKLNHPIIRMHWK